MDPSNPYHPNDYRPIFADVFINEEKVGHCATDGFDDRAWTFYPRRASSKRTRGHAVDPISILPKYAQRAGATIGPRHYIDGTVLGGGNSP